MVVNCVIAFDGNPHGIFLSGQMMTGTVTLTTDKVKKLEAVILTISGFTKTSWSEDDTDYGKRIKYLSSATYLQRSNQENSTFDLAMGTHRYTFACHIPFDCPSSIESENGHTRYTIKVTLERPWAFNQNFTQGFTVISTVDLNHENPALKQPVRDRIEKSSSLFSSKLAVMEMCVPRSCYVPGEIIPITVNIVNKPVNGVKVSLIMRISCYEKEGGKNKIKNNVTVHKLKGRVSPNQPKYSVNFEMRVPATPPTCIDQNQIIKWSYELCAEIKIPGLFNNESLKIPIKIGSVPLMDRREIATTSRSHQSEDRESSPPSYAEALHMPRARLNPDDEQHDYGEKDFAPKYPFFNLGKL